MSFEEPILNIFESKEAGEKGVFNAEKWVKVRDGTEMLPHGRLPHIKSGDLEGDSDLVWNQEHNKNYPNKFNIMGDYIAYVSTDGEATYANVFSNERKQELLSHGYVEDASVVVPFANGEVPAQGKAKVNFHEIQLDGVEPEILELGWLTMISGDTYAPDVIVETGGDVKEFEAWEQGGNARYPGTFATLGSKIAFVPRNGKCTLVAPKTAYREQALRVAGYEEKFGVLRVPLGQQELPLDDYQLKVWTGLVGDKEV